MCLFFVNVAQRKCVYQLQILSTTVLVAEAFNIVASVPAFVLETIVSVVFDV